MKLLAADVQSLVVPGSGHWLAEKAPEATLAALTEFLAPYRDASAAPQDPGALASAEGHVMGTMRTTYDEPSLGAGALRPGARALLGQVMGAVVIAASIFLDIFNVFLLVLDLFGSGRE